jgi:hypothetical protein
MNMKKVIGIFFTILMIIAASPLVGGITKKDITLDVCITTDFINGYQDYGLKIKEYDVGEDVWLYTEFSGSDLYGINVSTDYYYDNGDGLEYRFSWWRIIDGHYESDFMWSFEPMGLYYGQGYGHMVVTADGEFIGKSNFYAMGNTKPNMPTISGPTEGRTGRVTDYTFMATDPDGFDIYLCVNWGDDTGEIPYGPYPSGEEVTLSHIYDIDGDYVISCTAKDLVDNESEAATLSISMPKSKSYILRFSLFERFLEQYLNSFPILRLLQFK